MQQPPLEPHIADLAPTDAILTGYDEAHLVTYLRLLDADADGLCRMLRNLHLS